MGLSELAEHAGFDKATSHRLARILVRHGWLVQDEETRRYRLGVRVLDLGFAYLAGLDLRERALPHMERLGRDFGGSVSLAQLDGADIVYLERILASLPDAQVRSLLRGKKLQAQTPNTVTSIKQLLEQLGAIRARGFAINDEETVIGLRSVAATIRDHQGSPIAALNVAVPTARCTLERLASVVGPRVVQAAEAITAELGYRPPA